MLRFGSLLVLLFSLSMLSCKKNETPQDQYAGNWKGNYTGTGDNGSWNITIDGEGKITGTFTSVVSNQTIATTGSKDIYGNLSFGTASSAVLFTGKFTSNTEAKGTWTNTITSTTRTGSWSGNKQ
ncbi:MAG: hypothetical protein JWQ96_2914 [Segetibacter sp.]|nr:hypothetical protein [Segetibacter sp.]